VTVAHAAGRDLRVDAIVLRPEVMWKRYGAPGERLLLLKSWSSEAQRVRLDAMARSEAIVDASVRAYDAHADLVHDGGPDASVELPPFGFALVRWSSDEPVHVEGRPSGEAGASLEATAAFSDGSFTALDLRSAFNNDAFSTPSQPLKGNFDSRSGVLGATFPAERAPGPLERVDLAGVPFLFPPTDADANNVALTGQRLDVPPGRYEALELLGVSEQGNYQATAPPGVRRRERRGDTCSASPTGARPRATARPSPSSSPSAAVPAARSSASPVASCARSLTVRADALLRRIELPDRETMHLFALTLRHAR
jgi:hypothetical protein